MELYTKSCYNPYFINVNGKEYELDSIKVFTKDTVIATTCGWFGSNNNCRNLIIDCDCVRKVKVDLNMKTAFIVKTGNGWDGPRYALYIPDSVVKLNAPVRRKTYNGEAIEVTIKSSVYEPIVFTSFIWVNKRLTEIRNQIHEIGELIKSIYSNNISKLSEYIERLENLNNEYLEAQRLMNEIDVDTYEEN